jgi:gas vesicle protein
MSLLSFVLKEEDKMEERKCNHKGLVKGFLIGGVLGATAGILFAPKAGKELRSEIKERGEKTLKDTKQFYSDTKERADTVCENVKSRILACGGGKVGEVPPHNIESPEEVVSEA